MKSPFETILKNRSYIVKSKRLAGGYVNSVALITTIGKDGKKQKYILKKYNSEKAINEMLRGYSLILHIVPTPFIVYINKEKLQVAFEYIEGKDIFQMIKSKDPKVHHAFKILAKELEKLHRYKLFNPHYRKGNSPDERKMISHCIQSIKKNNIGDIQANKILHEIQAYIPKTKSIIHGDAHLRNFVYYQGIIYFIDSDNVKVGDLNADLGRLLSYLDIMEDKKHLSAKDARVLKEIFLHMYGGEDYRAVLLYKLRAPLRIAKEFGSAPGHLIPHPRRFIEKVLAELEHAK